MKANLFACILLAWPLLAPAQEFVSAKHTTDVVELFTSEGCSSCPRADEWLSEMKGDKGLFKDFIPMAFHVDYWNQLGWTDRFSREEYSESQRDYVRSGLVAHVYTPGIVVNSKEWRRWFSGARRWHGGDAEPGVLSAQLQDGRLHASFAASSKAVLNVAYLGVGLTSEIKAGENRGRMLMHDFVVLDRVQTTGAGEWDIELPPPPQIGQEKTALAIWVSPPDSPRIIQAVGGYLQP
ncbi:DUF1223 domain-containing protein [Hahella sp. KA22]|uniref:DUF1223 domain-containing protein n=1 Tax=Hahella sp. KA22 TaxID=1628392 RepID=UPI001012A3F8|nr:DUF1223 domain-containing protein [Hahella sp. KA22]QAY53687.1 DUF1223 domain-containing protein [Hahella sp. KA22]